MKPKFLYFQPEITITTLSGILWGLIELGYEAREGQILVPDSEYDDEILSKVKSARLWLRHVTRKTVSIYRGSTILLKELYI